ncbi:hypothetical protein F3Y22_tig00110325pilonHSYRG00138 [Hibiscus syriacus]|uniref:Pectinesterase catalytic domain-containing protein n=1 Tax=Hibiscus syriacus TaxID=106335 RepID=A0A6A3AZQ4_HIBSY|nr:hypothetical protein F3Y22_tig00110325pilonHSYRG00138 [Hibiscus syriacus]
MNGQMNTVTAQGDRPNENTGIIIHNSRVTASSEMRASGLDGVIDAEGWLPWSGNFALSSLYYAEHMNTGAGASTAGRVKWGGFHVITDAEAGKFTVGNFLAGNAWIPGTGVPFDNGL